MTIDLLKRFLQFCLFVLVQALILNRILLFGCAMPLLYVYFVILFPRNYPKWGILLWSFAMGLSIDMFSNTPGIGSASLTLIGALQPLVLELCLPREADENLKPSLRTLGTNKFVFFAFTLTAIFCITFFTLEAFTFFNWLQWLQCIGGSLLLTLLLIITLESIRK
jgi:rod shape-determining protein MreD